ncbi:MAG: acyltransferase [Syntrophaceae bacterium]
MGSNINIGILSQIYASGGGLENIVIKNNVSLNSNVMINADHGGYIEIGENCIIGPNVVIRTSNHEFSSKDEPIRNQGHRPGKIILQENTWIGANCTIIGNVTIGKGTVIGAGSVVNKDIESFVIAAGVPARVIGKR